LLINSHEDVDDLVLFLKQLNDKMDFFMLNRAHYFFVDPLFDNSNDYSLLNLAWKSIKPRFEKLQNYLYNQQSYEQLHEVGLTGNELQLKLYVVKQSLSELETQEKKFQKIAELKGRGKGFRFWHWLRKLKEKWEKYFDHSNTILGSLGSAGLPGSEAINEFKIVLEKLLHWWKKQKTS